MSDKNTEIKIKMEGLQKGMYVSRVDRPWSDLPTNLQGVVIQSNEQIDMLNKYCNYVYVDSSKGKSPAPMYWIIEENNDKSRGMIDLGKNEYTLLRKEHYETTVSLDNEMGTAKDVYHQVSQQIMNSFEKLRNNQDLDMVGIQGAVEQTVNSVVRNPTALKFVMDLQRTDQYTYDHALATSVWAAQFGRHLGLDKEAIKELSLGGLLLDIGKSKIPASILTKETKLTRSEKILLRSHVDEAVKILVNYPELSSNVVRMVATHHERANGKGYPLGLLNKDIPIYGRIAGIVDSFDAMTNKRPHKKRYFSPHEAISQLYELRNTLFQAELVEQFIQTVGMYPTGTLVELNTGEIAVVTAINGLKRLKPTVMVILDENKQMREEFKTINIAEEEDYSVKRTLKRGAYGIKMEDLFL